MAVDTRRANLRLSIVNPLTATITVLVLEGETYLERSVFHRGEQAASKLLDGFIISVDEVLDAK